MTIDEGQVLLSSPVARALNVIGDRWTCLILRDVFLGRRRFAELLRHTGATRATLTKRLKTMVYHGILYRNPYQKSPVRFEYRMTDKGFDLYDFALAIWRWETRWSRDDEQVLPPRLTHLSCGEQFDPGAVCSRCNLEIALNDVRFEAGPGAGNEPALNFGHLRRSRILHTDNRGTDASLFHVTDLIADHWTPLVLAATLVGLRRFDDIQSELSISTNILADRLKLLVDALVLHRVAYQDNPPRYEYALSDKGEGLYATTLALHQWAETWLASPNGPSLFLYHKCSDKPLQMHMNCSACGERVHAHNVRPEMPRATQAAG